MPTQKKATEDKVSIQRGKEYSCIIVVALQLSQGQILFQLRHTTKFMELYFPENKSVSNVQCHQVQFAPLACKGYQLDCKNPLSLAQSLPQATCISDTSSFACCADNGLLILIYSFEIHVYVVNKHNTFPSTTVQTDG